MKVTQVGDGESRTLELADCAITVLLATPAPKGGTVALVHDTDPAASDDAAYGAALGAVMAAMAERPQTGWRTSELVRHLGEGVSVLEVVRVISEGHCTGALERIGPATYRLATLPQAVTALRNEAQLWA